MSLSATGKTQHFAEYYTTVAHKKVIVNRKGVVSGLTYVGDTMQLRLEPISCGTQSLWTGDTEIFWCGAVLYKLLLT